jgi:hypothetical protein
MRRALLATLAGLSLISLLVACQRGEGKTPFQRDMERICHAERLSGAHEQHEGHRSLLVGQWLAENLETPEARSLLAQIFQAAPAEKSALLTEAAREAGIRDCPIAQVWGR